MGNQQSLNQQPQSPQQDRSKRTAMQNSSQLLQDQQNRLMANLQAPTATIQQQMVTVTASSSSSLPPAASTTAAALSDALLDHTVSPATASSTNSTKVIPIPTSILQPPSPKKPIHPTTMTTTSITNNTADNRKSGHSGTVKPIPIGTISKAKLNTSESNIEVSISNRLMESSQKHQKQQQQKSKEDLGRSKSSNELFSQSDIYDTVCGSPLDDSKTSNIAIQRKHSTAASSSSVDSSQSYLASSFSQTVAITPLLSNYIPPSVDTSRKSLIHPSKLTANALGIIDTAKPTTSTTELEVEPTSSEELHQKQPHNLRIPTLISWNNGMCRQVYVIGTFNDWKEKIPLQKGKNDFTCVLNLKPGSHRLKFIVDGEWRCSNELDTALDINGNLVNYLEVRTEDLKRDVVDLLDNEHGDINNHKHILASDYDDGFSQNIPDYLQQQSSTIPDRFPPQKPHAYSNDPYLQSMGHHHTFQSSTTTSLLSGYSYSSSSITRPNNNPLSEKPPNLPPYLDKIVLNSQALKYQNAETHIVPTPNHVCLNHLYALSIRDGVMGLASTRRFRKKYITTVYYRPVNRSVTK